MVIFDLSQELIQMFVSFFNDVLSPFRLDFKDLPFPSFFQDFFDFLMNAFGYDIKNVSLLGFMFGSGMFIIFGVTLFKWVKEIFF